MKKTIYHSLLLAAIIPFTTMCSKENNQGGAPQPDTLEASVFAAEEKVSFTPDDSKLTLAWEAGDQLRVSGTTSEVYTIMEGFSGHKASFEGNTVKGTSFDIFYPASYATKDAIMGRTYTGQVQDGNGDAGHLEYNALIEGASDYHVVVFDKSQPNVKLNGVLKLVVKMPAGVSGVKSISLSAPSAIFYNDNAGSVTTDNIGISFSEGTTVDANSKVTAYIMTSMKNVTVAAGTKLTIKVTVPDKGCYYTKTFSNPSAISLNGGETLNIDISDVSVMTHKVAGAGTKASPYELWDKEDMEQVKSLLSASSQSTTYFKMMDNIDISSISNWSPITTGKSMDFDGNGKTLSGMTVTNGNYGSFVGVLVGKLHDMTFSGATVTQNASYNKGIGVVAGFCGTSTGSKGTVENVTITGSTVTQENSNGDAAVCCGRAANATFINVTIDNTCAVYQKAKDPTGSSCCVGGIVGSQAYYPSSYSGCTVNASINGTVANNSGTTVTNNYAVGGIVGSAGSNSKDTSTPTTISGCKFNGSFSQVTGSKYVGGVVGLASGGGTVNITKCANLAKIWFTQSINYVGGIAGYLDKGTISECYNTGDIKASTDVGGIVGSLLTGYNYIDDCYNNATIDGAQAIGGIAGEVMQNNVVRRVYSKGIIDASRCGGSLIGRATNGGWTATGDGYNNKFYSMLAFCDEVKFGGTTIQGGSGISIGYSAIKITWKYCYAANTVTFTNTSGRADATSIGVVYSSGSGTALPSGSYCDGSTYKYWYPFHSYSTKMTTVSSVAGYINEKSTDDNCYWSASVWDLSGDDPKLKNNPES